MRVVVTGGSGFIGSRLLSSLVRRGHDVICLDISPPEPSLPATYCRADVTLLPEMVAALTGADAVFHLAGFVLDGFNGNPCPGLHLNVVGTACTLEACRLAGVRRFLFASSFRVYEGSPAGTTVDETTPLDPLRLGAFALSKLSGEALVWEYARRYGLRATVLRFGSAYGSAKASNAVGSFVAAGLAGRPVEVWGQGRRTNQYTHVDDVAEGCALALTGPEGTFNLVSPQRTSTRELVELLQRHLPFQATFAGDKKEGPDLPYISPDRAQRQLGWKTTSLEASIPALLAEHAQAATWGSAR